MRLTLHALGGDILSGSTERNPNTRLDLALISSTCAGALRFPGGHVKPAVAFRLEEGIRIVLDGSRTSDLAADDPARVQWRPGLVYWYAIGNQGYQSTPIDGHPVMPTHCPGARLREGRECS